MGETEDEHGEADGGESESGQDQQTTDDHADEVYIDTENLPATLQIIQAGAVDKYFVEIGIDPAIFAEEGEGNV